MYLSICVQRQINRDQKKETSTDTRTMYPYKRMQIYGYRETYIHIHLHIDTKNDSTMADSMAIRDVLHKEGQERDQNPPDSPRSPRATELLTTKHRSPQ